MPEMIHAIQHEITRSMYAILVDWLIEIGTISDQTLCLAIHLLDEYLQTTVIARSHFQLIGCTCLLIASKLEEIQFPSIDDLVMVACNCFTAEEMIVMEQKILLTLNYNIPRPTRSYFLERFLLVSRVDCLDLQARKKFTPLPLSVTSSSSLPTSPPPHSRHNLSPALSTLTDEETSPYSFSAISSHPEPLSTPCALRTPTKPMKPTASSASASQETINSFDDIDLTSNESQSQLDSSPLAPQSLPSYTPQHGYIASNHRHLREESFARVLLHTTLQV
jgi:hypothetical protein